MVRVTLIKHRAKFVKTDKTEDKKSAVDERRHRKTNLINLTLLYFFTMNFSVLTACPLTIRLQK